MQGGSLEHVRHASSADGSAVHERGTKTHLGRAGQGVLSHLWTAVHKRGRRADYSRLVRDDARELGRLGGGQSSGAGARVRRHLRLTPFRRAAAAAALAAGFAWANLAVGLPLLALAHHSSPALAAVLVGTNTLAFVLGSGVAGLLRRTEAGMAFGLGSVAAGDLIAALFPSSAGLAAGAVVNGVGMGLFWVGAMAALGGRAGATGSPLAFVGQYVVYTAGSAAGGALTGVAIAGLHALGLGLGTSIRLSLLLGVLSAAAALPSVLAWLRGRPDHPARQGIPNPLRGMAIQIPDLLLTGSAGLFVALTPIVLHESFRFTPAEIGAVSGAAAGAKILGSIAAGWIGGRVRVRRMAPTMLLVSAFTVGALAASRPAWLYVVLLLLSIVLALGAWPVLVDGALARVAPAERLRLSISWNMREYAVIAASTAGGGYLVRSGEPPTLLLTIAAALLLAAAIGAAAMLRRPVHDPSGRLDRGALAVAPYLPHVVHHPKSLETAPTQATDPT